MGATHVILIHQAGASHYANEIAIALIVFIKNRQLAVLMKNCGHEKSWLRFPAKTAKLCGHGQGCHIINNIN